MSNGHFEVKQRTQDCPSFDASHWTERSLHQKTV